MSAGLQRRRRPQDDRQRPARHRLHARLRHRGQHRARGRRSAAHDGGEPSPRDGGGGDGTPRRLDRGQRRHGRRRGLHPDPREALPPRGHVPDAGGAGGAAGCSRSWSWPKARTRRRGAARERRLRASSGIGYRVAARDRGAPEGRDPRHGPRPRPARRLPHRLRPRARHPLRDCRRGARARGPVRRDGRAPGHAASSPFRSTRRPRGRSTVDLEQFADAEVFFG